MIVRLERIEAARHEAGHAVSQVILRPGEPLFKVEIWEISGYGYTGRMMRVPEDARPRPSPEERHAEEEAFCAKHGGRKCWGPEDWPFVSDYLLRFGIELYAGAACQDPSMTGWWWD